MPMLKVVEVLVLLAAVIAFAWWQLRDVKRAQAQTLAKSQAPGVDDPGISSAQHPPEVSAPVQPMTSDRESDPGDRSSPGHQSTPVSRHHPGRS